MMGAAFERWERFWFAPVPTSTLAIFRAAYGLVVFLWTVSLLPDVLNFFSRDGVFPERELVRHEVGILNWFPHDAVVIALVVALLVASLATMLGYRTRVATVIVFVVLLSLRRRNPWIMNSGDTLLRHMGFFLMFAPAGAALSLDRWRRTRERFWEMPLRAPWAQRLIQIQVSFVYLFTVWAKARSEEWIEGTAVFSSMRVGDLVRFDIPQAWTESLLLGNLVAYGTLVVELALAVLIWNRRARPFVIGAGVLLHLFIETTFALGFFSTAIFVSYLSFVPEDTAERWLARVRERLAGSRLLLLRRVAAAGPGGASVRRSAGSAGRPVLAGRGAGS